MAPSGHRSRISGVRVILVAMAVLLALAACTASALAPHSVLAAEIDVIDQSVAVDFPESITFRLSAETSGDIERVELRYQPATSDVSRAIRPAFTPGSSLDISYELDTMIRYLPPGIDIHYRWIVTLEDGAQLETPSDTFFYIDNRYQWREVSDGLVTVYYYAGGDAFGAEAMAVTQRTIDRFSSDFDAPLLEPIRLVIYGSVREFQSALPYNSPEWIGGFADPGMNLIVAGVEPGAGAGREMGRMLSHEAIHLMVAQTTDNAFNRPPPWLDEGLAVIYQEVPDVRFARILELARDDGRLIPIRALNSSFPSDPDLAVQSYAQSENIVGFLIETRGHESVAALLTAYREGVSHEEAVQTALGLSLDELDAEWKDWLGYEGDRQAGLVPATEDPSTAQRLERFLAAAGLAPVLMLAGLVVILLGLSTMVRALRAPADEPDADDATPDSRHPFQP
jgi:hypothetical protein